jgi:hypothetical protein
LLRGLRTGTRSGRHRRNAHPRPKVRNARLTDYRSRFPWDEILSPVARSDKPQGKERGIRRL